MEKPKIHAYGSAKIDKKLGNSTDERYSQKIYMSMSHIYINSESTRIEYGDRSQMKKCILGSGDNCHMTPEI